MKGEDQHLLVWTNPADICTESPDYTGTARMLATVAPEFSSVEDFFVIDWHSQKIKLTPIHR